MDGNGNSVRTDNRVRTAPESHSPTPTGTSDELVSAVRRFNRFYTGILGLLDEGLLDTPYSLTEARVIYELAQSEATEVVALRQATGLDGGYLSRVLSRLTDQGLVARQRSGSDARRQVVSLTGQGREAFETLDARSGEQIAELLNRLDAQQRRKLASAMSTVSSLLGEGSRQAPSLLVLRAPQPGDLGWVVQRHGALYAKEHAWNADFEGLVAEVVADYVTQTHEHPGRVAAWIAEVDHEPVGCIFCMQKDAETAQLRLLLVEPGARGLGVGGRLIQECLRFAQEANYEQIVLWTNDVLTSARRLYERAGFTLDREDPHHSFGHDLVGQFWSRPLED